MALAPEVDAGRCGDPAPAVVADPEVPTLAVDDTVVMATQERHELDVGRSEIPPPLRHMVGITVLGSHSAAGEHTPAITDLQRLALLDPELEKVVRYAREAALPSAAVVDALRQNV